MRQQGLMRRVVLGCLFTLWSFPLFGQAINMMPLGDSITQGDKSTSNGGYRKNLYTLLTNDGVTADFVGSLNHGDASVPDTQHEGHGGFKADQLLANLTTYLNNVGSEKVVFLHIGTNDVGNGETPASTITEIEGIIDGIKNHDSSIEIFVATLIPADTTFDGEITNLNALIVDLVSAKRALGYRIFLADHNQAFKSNGNWATQWMFDEVHPNDAGYDVMASTWYEAFAQHSQYSENNFVDDFNRPTLGTADWTVHTNMQIVNGLELGNTAGVDDWSDGTKGYIAMQKTFTDANRVSFTYGAGLTGSVTDFAGVCVLFDSASTTGTGYFINRYYGNGTTSGNNGKLRLWNIVDGLIVDDIAETPYTQGTALPGDEFTVEIISTGNAHVFNCYLNGVLDGTLTEPNKIHDPAVRYSGAMIYGNQGAAARIDNFALQQAGEDTEPPDAISDLSVGLIGATTVELTWTAPGDDDNSGTAVSYDMRYSTSPIGDDAAFDLATPATGEPTPQASGNSEDMIVGNLLPGTLYYFAIKTSDDAGNVSALSNQPSATTTPLISTSDDFNRTGPALGADWVADPAYQIVDVGLSPDNELKNTSTTAGEWKLAVFTKRKNITNVSFRWGVGANGTGIENGGPALLLDLPTTTANGYMAQWRTATNQVRVLRLVNGQPDTPVGQSAYPSGANDPQAGDIVEIKMSTDGTGLSFDFYVNGTYYKRITDATKPNFDFNQDLYGGVTLQSNLSNNIDDFTVAVAPGDPASLVKISGDAQTDTVSQRLPLPFVVQVRDGGDNPLSNINLNFTVTGGGGILDSPVSPDGNVHVEAETGVVVAPMVVKNDATAAGGKYIEGAGAGKSTFIVNLPSAGNWRVWGRTIAPNGGSDSFFFKMDNDARFYWKVFISSDWTWDTVSNDDVSSATKVFNNLSAGNHTVVVESRDPGTKLDKLILTKDPNFTPTGKQEIGFVTDASGNAQAYLTLGPNKGPNTVQVSYGTLSPVVFTANAVGGNAKTIEKTSGDNQNGAGGAVLAQPFVVTVRDDGTNVVEGHPVTFVVTQGGGTLSNSQPVLTDANGQASTILTLGREVATQTVEAQAPGLNGSPIVFTATASGGIASKLVLVSGNNQTGTVGGLLTNPIIVKVTDASDGAIPNYPVELTVTRGGGSMSASNRIKNAGFENGKSGSGPFIPTDWQLLGSPSSGEVDVVTTDKHNGTSSARLNVNANGEGIAQQYNTLLGNTSYTLVFWAKVSSGTLLARWYTSGATAVSMQVTAAGNGNIWKKYQISANNASNYSNSLELSGVGNVNAFIDDIQLIQNTNGSGQLSTTWTLGDTAMVQQAQATATANNIALLGSPLALSATANAGPASVLELVDGNNQTGSAGSPLVNPLRVRVEDAFGNPKQGHTVNWSVTAGGGTLPGGVTSLPVVTGADGIASVIPTLGPTPGAINNFRATATGLSGSPITFTATAIVPDNFSITAGNNQIASASLLAPTPLTVRIGDVNQLPISGYNVLFEVIQGNGKINNASSVTIKTDANGEAKAPFVLGPGPGALNKVRASAMFNNSHIAGSPVTFDISAAKLTTLNIFSGNGQSGVVGLPLPQPLKAVVHDSLGNGIKGQQVTFTITGGGGKINGAITPLPVLTDSLGIAQVTLTLGTTPGTNNNTVKAETSTSLTGSPLTFTASATPDLPANLIEVSGDSQSVVINNQLPLPLKVKVTDKYGNAVAGHPVKFKIKAGGGKVNGADSTTVNTQADGTAQVNMTVGSISGLLNNICEVTAKNGPVHLTDSPITFLATATPSVARSMEEVSGNGQAPDTVGAPIANHFVVRVEDSQGNPVPNHPVTFRVIAGNGRLDGGVDTVKTVATDASGATIGQARVKLTLGPVAGVQNKVRATSNDGISPLTGSPIDFTATSVAGAPSATVSTVQATTPIAANGTDKSTVTITVRDNFGNPLQGIPLAILVSGSNNFIDPVVQLTTSNGQATGSFASTRAEVKTVTARVIGGVEITNGAQVLFQPLAAAKLVSVSGNNQTANVGTALANPLAVQVTDIFDNSIGGHPVTFSVQSGGGFFAGTQPVLTDNQGVANGVWVLGPNAGSNLANASSAGLNGSPVTFTATGVVSAAVKLNESSGNSQQGPVSEELPDSIVVKVTDSTNKAVFDHPVKFKVIFGGGKVNSADSAIVRTDFLGLARVAWSMGAQVGSNFCTATATGLSNSPITFAGVGIEGRPVSFEITEGQGATNTVVGQIGPLKVQIKDAVGNGVSGVQVNFSLTSGTGTLSANQVLTVDGGYAWVFLIFGTNSGPRTVVASANGLQPSTLTFNVIATPGPAKSMAINHGNNQSGTVSKPLNFPLEVIVKDQYSNPVGSTAITFVHASGPGGNFSGNPTIAVQSNSAGIASAVWTLGSSAGSYQAQALNNNLTGSPLIFGATAFTNNFPIITDVANVNINENDHIEFTINASDADGDPMTYGAKNLPPGAVYDSLASRLFSWTTNYNNAGVYNISFLARDNKGGIDEEVVTITVNNVNRLPVIASRNPVRSDTTLANGIDLLMKVTVTDADGDPLTYLWSDNTIPVSTTNTYLLKGSVIGKVHHNVIVRISDGVGETTFNWGVVSKVELSSFSAAVGDRGGVVLNWKTSSQSNNTGFNVMRSRSQVGGYERVNDSLIRHRDDGEYSFTDRNVQAGARYYYKLQDLDVDGNITEHGPLFIEVALPDAYVLHQNYPNPFNPTTNISFQLPKSGEVTLTIYNLLGQPVRRLVQGERPAGSHIAVWDGRNDHGEVMASGIYHYRLQAGSFSETKKMLLMK